MASSGPIESIVLNWFEASLERRMVSHSKRVAKSSLIDSLESRSPEESLGSLQVVGLIPSLFPAESPQSVKGSVWPERRFGPKLLVKHIHIVHYNESQEFD